MSSWIVEIPVLPTTIEEYIELRDAVAQTPQGGAAMMVLALYAFTLQETLGRQCLTIAVDRDRLVPGTGGYKDLELRNRDIRRIEQQIKNKPYVPRSYLQDTSPETGYELPDPPYTIVCSDNPHSGDPHTGQTKLFITCSGASSPRPVSVKRNNRGIWKASEWSSLLVGITPPKKNTDDDL
jgi:hypothetical protein